MTEASPATHYSVPTHSRLGKVGPLVPNTECRIVDPATGRDARRDQPGEVWVRGPQVMKGYLNNRDATAATFDADGWLHTGDIGTVDDDGFLEVTDRLKELIKVIESENSRRGRRTGRRVRWQTTSHSVHPSTAPSRQSLGCLQAAPIVIPGAVVSSVAGKRSAPPGNRYRRSTRRCTACHQACRTSDRRFAEPA